MKSRLVKILTLLLVFSLVLGIAACQPAGSAQSAASANSSQLPSASGSASTSETTVKPVTLKVLTYHIGNDFATEYYKKLFEEFPKTPEGKGISFEFEEIPNQDAFSQKLKLLISSGELPDIVQSAGLSLTELAVKAGKVADLTSYFDADPEWKSTFDPKSLELNSVDGKIYGIPNTKTIAYIYYNKELFKKAGVEAPATGFASWDDFFAACDKLKTAGITPLAMDSGDFGWISNLWMSSMIATANEAGNKWMNTLHPKDFNTPEVIAAAKNIQKMFKEYTTKDAPGGKYDPMATHFFNGEVAMITNGPWMVADFSNKEKAPAGFYDKVGAMLFPCSGMIMEAFPGDMVGAKDKDKIDAAVKFLKYQTSLDNQLLAIQMVGIYPESPKITIPDSYKQKEPLMASIIDMSTKAKTTYGENQVLWYQNNLDAFSTLLPELAFDKITPEEFCTKMSETAQKNKD